MTLTVTKTQVTPLPGCIVRTVKLAEAASAGQAMTADSNGNYVKADANATSLWRGVCVLLFDNQGTGNVSGDYANGDEVSAAFFGPIAGFSAMDPTKSVWVDTTAGGFTQTKPSGANVFPSPMGHPLATNVFFVAPQPADTTY